MDSKDFKTFMYEQIAGVAKVFSAPKRLELLNILAQGKSDVDGLAKATSMSIANTSRHLQVLKQARFVVGHREGVRRVYQLASDEVLHSLHSIQELAQKQNVELQGVIEAFYQ